MIAIFDFSTVKFVLLRIMDFIILALIENCYLDKNKGHKVGVNQKWRKEERTWDRLSDWSSMFGFRIFKLNYRYFLFLSVLLKRIKFNSSFNDKVWFSYFQKHIRNCWNIFHLHVEDYSIKYKVQYIFLCYDGCLMSILQDVIYTHKKNNILRSEKGCLLMDQSEFICSYT